MYGAIPDVVISKQPPRNNQLRVVVALGVAVLQLETCAARACCVCD